MANAGLEETEVMSIIFANRKGLIALHTPGNMPATDSYAIRLIDLRFICLQVRRFTNAK